MTTEFKRKPVAECEPGDVDARTPQWYLGSNQNDEVHLAAWPDVQRSAEKNVEATRRDQVLHFHLHGQTCNKQCFLLGLES